MKREKMKREKRISEYLTAEVLEPLGDGDFRVEFLRHGMTVMQDNYYPEATLRAAADAGVFDGCKMYVNHASADDDARGHRDLGDWAGIIKQGTVRYNGNALEAVAHVHQPTMLTILQDAAAARAVGISHDSYVRYTPKTIDGQQVDVIDEITQCNSVDFVPEGNAWGRVLEAQRERQIMFAELTLEQLDAERPDLVEALTARAQEAAVAAEPQPDDTTTENETEEVDAMSDDTRAQLETMQEQVAALTAERDDLKGRLEREDAERATLAAVQQAVTTAGLADYEAARVMERFRGQIVAEADREHRIAEAIAAEQQHTAAVLSAAGVQTRVTEAGRSEQNTTDGYEAAHRAWCEKHGVEYRPLKGSE